MRMGIALVLGVAIAALDNFAFGGEISPIVIFGLLLLATGFIGLIWRARSWLAASVLWACIPAAHLIKRLFGLPDTIQPNTYGSIFKLAAVTLVVAVVGTACGVAAGRRKQFEIQR